jgi:hypothetical protein
MSSVRSRRRAEVEDSDEPLPSPDELFTPPQLLALLPHLLSENRLRHALRNRRRNGLLGRRDEHRQRVDRVVYETPLGKGLLIHKSRFVAWMCGLQGLRRPRGLRATALGDPNPPEHPAPDNGQPAT